MNKDPRGSIPAPIRRILMEIIESLSRDDTIIKSSGIDTARWRRLTRERLRANYPIVARALARVAVDYVIGLMIGAYQRSTRNAAVESLTDIDEIRRQVKAQNRLVAFRSPDGAYVRKRLWDCTPEELDTLAVMYQQSAESDLRRARYYEALARQMRLDGFDTATVRQWATR